MFVKKWVIYIVQGNDFNLLWIQEQYVVINMMYFYEVFFYWFQFVALFVQKMVIQGSSYIYICIISGIFIKIQDNFFCFMFYSSDDQSVGVYCGGFKWVLFFWFQ